MNTDWSAFTHLLKQRLNGPLPGFKAYKRLAPSYRLDAQLLSTEGKKCRTSAVLVLLYPHEGVPHVLLMQRTARGDVHGGQLSFPGGACEMEEGFCDTAQREAEEELGLSRTAYEVIGELTSLYIPPSRFCVWPYVAIAPELPALMPSAEEVERIVPIPLPALQRADAVQFGEWEVRGVMERVPYFAVDAVPLWGATAMMLAELLHILEEPAP